MAQPESKEPETAQRGHSADDRHAEPKLRHRETPAVASSRLHSVSVPPELEPLFLQAQQYVADYFNQRHQDPHRGTISIAGERYILVRAASMSVEFFDLVLSLYRDRTPAEAWHVANNLLFDIAHAIGKADARSFHERMRVQDPIQRLSAGPIHFAYAGWAFVRILPESTPTPDENFYLIYDHPYSFESDAWITRGRQPNAQVCIMNAGYSSGWCAESFGLPLVAVEVECRARGDPRCRFIMAPPSRIEAHLARCREQQGMGGAVSRPHAPVSIPEFFQRKKLEDEIRASHEELERRVWERTAELAAANRALEQTIRERAEMEQRLVQMHKMESIGRLAGGVAHDFNNLLMATLSFVEVARIKSESGQSPENELRGIRQASERAVELTRQLLTFARRQPIQLRNLDINALLQESGDMLRLLTGSPVELIIEPQPDLWPVLADPGQIQRALINLVVNAKDAMPRGGRITIRTRNVSIDGAYASRHADAAAGDHVAISVADTGEGMSPEVQARIFEPFFTTKSAGEGTGLGLAIVYGIARQHEGHITVSSEPGRGSTFELFLPRAAGQPESPARPPDSKA